MRKLKKLLFIFYFLLFTFVAGFSFLQADTGNGYNARLKEGILAVNEEEYIAAMEIFEGLIDEDPTRAEAFCGMAIISISTGCFTSARDYLFKAVESNADYSQSYYLLGMVEEELKNFTEALKNYEEYLRLVPDTLQKEEILKRIDYLKGKADD